MNRMRAEVNGDGAEEAAGWQARLAAPDCTGVERRRFEAWRTKSPANARASDTAARVDAVLEHLGSTDEQLLAMTDEAFAAGAAPLDGTSAGRVRALTPRVRRWAVPAALAASLVIAAVLIRFVSQEGLSTSEVTARLVASDARRDFTLADGSVVHLDVESELSARLGASRRDIELLRGRALFEVAHDSARPFTVAAGNTRVTALGTQFQVQRESDHVTVTLTEGSVAVADTSEPSWAETLRPGEAVRVPAVPGAHMKRAADVQVATSWSRGRHVFRGTPLAQAVQEVNYYAERKVRLGDPELAELTVGGNFVAGDSESVVAALAAALPVRVVDAGGELILFRRYEAESH